MMIDNQQIQDPSVQGVKGLRGLEGINRLKERGINIDTSIFNLANNYRGEMNRINTEASPKQEIGFVGVNDSIYDEEITSASQLDNLNDIRARLQPWYAKIGAGLAKGTITAGTTFLDGTVGLAIGAATAAKEGRWSGIWDNDFSKAMQAITEKSEELLPNYYTDEEQNNPWYENIFTANFIGDKFIKNLGFTIGAFYSGGVASKALQATRLPAMLGAITKSLQVPRMVSTGVGATLSALNEGRIEAINNSKDWFNLQKEQLDDKHNAIIDAINNQYAGTELHDDLISKANNDYEEALGKLSEDRLKMGNMDLLMNIPILTASNIVQFGKLYAGGFKTTRKATNIIKNAGKYETTKTPVKGIIKGFGNALYEGQEEISQRAASTIAGYYYEDDVNNFYKSKIDPQAEQQTVNFIKSFAKGINDTVNDASSWEEFTIGALTGALGIPRFRSVRSSEGRFQSPVTLEAGIVGKYKDYMRERDNEQKIADYLNTKVNSPEFKNYYQGLIRHNKYQNDMDNAVQNDDEFEFKNAEQAQLISDITMFDNAGKLEDLVALINSSFDTSDENLQSLVDNTTSIITDENGNEHKIGPFIDEKGNPMFSTEKGKQEMIDKLTKSKDEFINKIDDYVKTKDDIDLASQEQLSNEQLEELVWLKSQINDWNSRAGSVANEIKPFINTAIGRMVELAEIQHTIKVNEGKYNAGITELYEKTDKNERNLRKNIESLKLLASLNDRGLAQLLAKKPNIVKDLKEVFSDSDYGVAADEITNVNKKLDDVGKLINATNKFETKFKKYLENPGSLQEDINNATESVAREEINKKAKDLRTRLSTVINLKDFRETLSSEEDLSITNETLDTLVNEGNELAKNYKEINRYNTEAKNALSSMNVSDSVKADALKLLQEQYDNASNLEEMANLNSVFIANENILHDDALSDEDNIKKFQEAQYALQEAMNKANESEAFKDRFSKPIGTTEEVSNTATSERETTGDSNVPVTETVKTSTPVSTVEKPVGDITSEQTSDENKQANERIEDNRLSSNKGARQYYKPAISELHIQASKEGDFREFPIVMKERSGADYSDIYNYLKEKGAFDYVNEGNLKPGDKIGFMVDPEFEERVKDKEWHKTPTIFLIDKKNGQVIGSLEDTNVSNYVGLSNLEDRVRKEFSERKDDKSKFISSLSTRVSQIMNGRVPYSNTERNLADIPNVSSESRKPVFGIVKNGTLFTNGQVDDNLVIKPSDITSKDGRMYLLIPNASGKYFPVAVRVKHFNTTEFNPNDVVIQNTQMFKNINKAIEELADSHNEEDLGNAVKTLAQNLYNGNLHIDWFTSDKGDGIRFTKVERDSNGNEIYEEKDGKRVRRETSKVVFLAEKDSNYLGSFIGDGGLTQIEQPTKERDAIIKEITDALLSFNLPIQVNSGMINRGGYNSMLIGSGILTSNISDARVIGSWFTTDYMDEEGNIHKAVNPVTPKVVVTPKEITPVGGLESVIKGTPIIVNGTSYIVDLTNNAIYDKNGNIVNPENKELIFDVAWVKSNFGEATEGSSIWKNKALLPNGKVLDMNTQKYIEGKESQEVKDRLILRVAKSKDAKEIIGQISENQKKIDREKTDSEHYYILEEDGQYHAYDRVHKRLGSNWIESKRQADALKDIGVKLSQNAENITQFNNYLTYLSKHYNTNLDSFKNKSDVKSRDAIVNAVRDKMSGINSSKALNAGTAVDSIIRSFFTSNNTPIRPSNMNEEAFKNLIDSLTEIRSNIESRGERFLTDNIVLFYKYADGTRVAGEVDILAVDANGNFKIYDIKTSRYSFHDFVDKYGNNVNYFINKSATQRMSTKDYYTLQLSAYKNLFEEQYGTPITTIAILPFVLNYNNDNVSSVTREKGIIITYNPNINSLMSSTESVKPVETNSSLPIFNSTFETLNPINDVLPEFKLEDGKIGYFMKDGKLHKGYISPIGKVNGIDIFITKIPNTTRGFGKDTPYEASASYMAIFPNGNSIMLIKNDPNTLTEQQVKDIIKKKLEGNPQRVVSMSNEKTDIFNPINSNNPPSSGITTLPSSKTSGASAAVKAEQEITEHNSEFEYDDDLMRLKEADKEAYELWDKDKEFAWLDKVLPQLSREDKVRIANGLIKVASRGSYAWGMFDNGVITLSNIAEKGTVYHEAFHVVFNLLLDQSEREQLFKEARDLYGDKDNISLEEAMADGFRDYVISQENKGLGRRILDFFKDLYAKITNWNKVRPSLISYYRAINKGEYATKDFTSFDITKDNVRYSKLQRESLSKYIDYNFNNAKHIIRYLNNRRYNTIEEALVAFKNSGVSEDFFYRITDTWYNGRNGYKIQLLTKDMYSKYKSDILEEYDVTHDKPARKEDYRTFDSLDSDVQMSLLNKGWTKEQFDSISQEERDNAVKCMVL